MLLRSKLFFFIIIKQLCLPTVKNWVLRKAYFEWIYSLFEKTSIWYWSFFRERHFIIWQIVIKMLTIFFIVKTFEYYEYLYIAQNKSGWCSKTKKINKLSNELFSKLAFEIFVLRSMFFIGFLLFHYYVLLLFLFCFLVSYIKVYNFWILRVWSNSAHPKCV